MEIKYEQKEITTTELVRHYIANDGKEFPTMWEAWEHERELVFEALGAIEYSEEAENYPTFDGGDHNENSNYYWYRPKNMDEVNLLKEYYPHLYLTEACVGEWLCIEMDEENNAWLTFLKDSISYARRLLSKLGYVMSVSEASTIAQDENDDGLDQQSKIVLDQLNARQQDNLYRHLWKQNVRNDIVSYAASIGVSLSDSEIEAAANRYVNGDYDCSMNYWDNIDSLIKKVTTSKEAVS